MTKKTRVILFSFLGVLFLITAFLTVFYSLGWRFNWQTKNVVKTGSFYFKVMPKNSQIYLDGKLKKKTDFFFGSALIENLLPKKYNVEIKKEGFFAWQKNLEIKAREVTEIKNVVLIPKNPVFSLLSQNVKDFYYYPDGTKIIVKEDSQNEDQGWELKLIELKKNLKSYLIGESDILSKSANAKKKKITEAQLLNLVFSPDLKRILLRIGVGEKIEYHILEIDKGPSGVIDLDFLEPDVEKIYFHPKNPQKLFIIISEKINSEGS